MLVSFHAGFRRSPEISTHAQAQAVYTAWEANFAETAPFVDKCLDPQRDERIRDLVGRYLRGREPLFTARIEAGKVCDGHGDLQAEDIFCLDDGPRNLDCVEFDDELRYADVLADVAFLVMDLERLGRPDAASAFAEAYEVLAGERFPLSLLHHYCAMRAYVRAKIACLRHDQGDESARADAGHLHGLALEYLETAQVRLVLIGGLPAIGKSTLAARLATSQGWALLRSDEVRKELFAPEPGSSGPLGYGQGIYDDEKTATTYRVLLERAGDALSLGRSVVIDASWSREVWRHWASDLAARSVSGFWELLCDLDGGEASRRLTSRIEAGSDVSDATPEVAALMAGSLEPSPSATVVETSATPARLLPRFSISSRSHPRVLVRHRISSKAEGCPNRTLFCPVNAADD